MSSEKFDFEKTEHTESFEEVIKEAQEAAQEAVRKSMKDVWISKKHGPPAGISHGHVTGKISDVEITGIAKKYRLPEYEDLTYVESKYEMPGALRFDFGDFTEPKEEERKPIDPDVDRRMQAIKGALSRSRRLGDRVEANIDFLKNRSR